MKLCVVIATADRRDVLAQTLQHLKRQSRQPDQIILSAPGPEHVPDLASLGQNIQTIFGPKGLARQRNAALAKISQSFDVITFFDDDFLPSTDYLERIERHFTDNAGFAVIHGNVVADGAHNSGFSFAEGIAMLEAAVAVTSRQSEISDHPGAYGCNMSVRASHVGDLRFDERLVLYGWQEDIDFTNQLGKFGRIISDSCLLGVHLGVKTGRVTGTRFGYSQIVNPIYLVRKGTMPLGFAVHLVARNVLANVVRSIQPEPWVDRRGRLMGNVIACGHVMRGRIEPEYVLLL